MGNHWYCEKTGAPRHTIANKSKGGTRNVTIRDARHHKLVPSVSGIIDVVDKPGLVEWKIREVLKACIDWPYEREWDEEVWCKQIKEMSGRATYQAAERGRQVHNSLEQYYIDGSQGEGQYKEVVKESIVFMNERFGGVRWVPEKTFAYAGYGGTCDVHSTEGDGFILDFKTKDTDNPKKMQAYMTHAMQLAAYRHGLGVPKAKCYNLFISVKQPGLLVLKEWSEEEIEKAYRMFNFLLNYWYLANNMERGD